MTSTSHETELEELRARLEEAEETLRAIRGGEIDALVVDGPEGERIFTLQGAEQPYRALIEAMQQGAATLSGDGVVLYCNGSFAELLGAPQEKVIGAAAAGLLPLAQRATFEALLRDARHGGSQGELHFQTAGGALRPVHLALNPLTLSEGSAICLVVTDLTERMKHRDLQDTSRRKDEFLAMLAHELRNPLAPILNAVTILEHSGVKNEQLTCACGIIDRQARHLARLVDDLLDASRISLGKVSLQKERIDLSTVIFRAVETSRPIIDARRQQLNIALPPEGIVLHVDPVRLAQVIGNLLTNAAKYTDEGGSIFLTAQRDAGEVLLRVRDTGMGIAAGLLPHVFDLFIQGDRSLARSEGGLGIGLTLVRRLVEMHGGTVRASSDGAGRGSEFVVRLPASAEQEKIADPRAEQAVAAGSGAARRILVVEDNRDGAESLAMLLRMMGHQVSLAFTGSEAIEQAPALRPHVVLLDIGLPGISGYDVVRQLRSLPGYEATVLVAMTGYGQEDDKQRSKEAGFHHHLTKPVNLGILRELLASLDLAGHAEPK